MIFLNDSSFDTDDHSNVCPLKPYWFVAIILTWITFMHMYMLGIGGSNLSRTVFFLIILLKSALQMFLLQIWGWATRAWDWGKGSFIWFHSWKNMIEENIYLFKSIWLIYWLNDGQEGAEEDLENNANEDVPGDLVEGEDKEEPEPVERPRKTSKYMTKYERARILGTRALQIRFSFFLFLAWLSKFYTNQVGWIP